MRATSAEVQPALDQLGAGGFRGAALGLPQRPAQHVHLVRQQGDLVEGRDEAPALDLGLGDPAEVAEFPQFDVHSREKRQNHPVQVSRLGEPLSEVLLRTPVLAVALLGGVWLYF